MNEYMKDQIKNQVCCNDCGTSDDVLPPENAMCHNPSCPNCHSQDSPMKQNNIATMEEVEKIKEEWEKKFPPHSQDSKCDLVSHDPQWAGDGYFCSKCKLRFIPKPTEKDPVEKCNRCQSTPCSMTYMSCIEAEAMGLYPSENVQSWGERLDSLPSDEGGTAIERMHPTDIRKLKQFISTEIQRAVEKDRLRILEVVRKLREEVLPTHAEENGYGCALDDVEKELIKK